MRIVLIFPVLLFFLFACGGEKVVETDKEGTNKVVRTHNEKTAKGGRDIINAGAVTQYTGKPGQLVVVAENTVYIDEIEQLFDSIFHQPIRPYYPMTPYFKVFQRSKEDFKKLSTQLRNVIELRIDEEVEKGSPKMFIYENYYSRTQLYTRFIAHDMVDLYQLLENELEFLFKIYDKQEWKREFQRHAKNEHKVTRKKLQHKFGIDLRLPSKFKYESIDDTYAILIFPERTRQMDLHFGSNNASKVNYINTGLMVWQYPYTDTSLLNPQNLMSARDTILKKYAQHEMDGVYMGTQYHPAVTPIYEPLRIGEVTGYQARGLFKFTGEAEPYGGRFWEYHFKHPHRNTIVAISGYIDAPPTMDVNLDINQIRAIIYSLKVVE